MNRREAPPKAGAMIEALRGLGYSTSTALADIIDNSIAAQASVVDIRFEWNGEQSRIHIVDNGLGMTLTELESAMRLGEKNPTDSRGDGDLGRFGLGLKTASFSQCRRLTVTTKKNEAINCLYWDLDVIASDPEDRWLLLDGPPESLLGTSELLLEEKPSGTVVTWELMDRVVPPRFSEQDFLDLIDQVESHLAMVFHRYLDGSFGRLAITVNGRKIAPWDPFMDGSLSKPWHSHSVAHPLDSNVELQCHVLPHKDRLSEEEYELYQGPDGWTAQQGFYVYRGGRMLVAGSWLGLGRGRLWTKDEAHRLARIRLDIPAKDDLAWKIDIKKATAKPPVHLREWLVQMAEITRHRARRVFAHRGQITPSGKGKKVAPVWIAKSSKDGVKYRIDSNNPAVRSVIDSAGSNLPAIKAMLRLIEETIPIQRIWLDTEEQKDTPRNRFYGDAPEQLKTVLSALFESMTKSQGISPSAAVEQLKRTDPFQEYTELVDELLNDYHSEA